MEKVIGKHPNAFFSRNRNAERVGAEDLLSRLEKSEVPTPSTKPRGSLNIAWIQTFGRKTGGCELSSQGVIDVGRSLGLNIKVYEKDKVNFLKLQNSDLAVINDIIHFSALEQSLIMEAMTEFNIPYVVYDHHAYDGNNELLFHSMFARSKLNVFISPLHAQVRLSQFGDQLKPFKNFLIYIDPEIYVRNSKIKREKNLAVVLVNNPHAMGHLSFKAYLEEHKNLKVEYYTMFPQNIPPEIKEMKQVEIKPNIKPEQVPDLLSRAEYLLQLSDYVRANDRVVFEAILCGAKPITTVMIGAGSWKSIFNINDKDLLRKVLKSSPFLFWRSVMEYALWK